MTTDSAQIYGSSLFSKLNTAPATPAGFADAIAAAYSRGINADEQSGMLAALYERTTDALIGWLSTGEVNSVNALVAAIRDQLSSNRNLLDSYSSLSALEKFSISLRHLAEVADVARRRKSAQSYAAAAIAKLNGPRHRAWRNVLYYGCLNEGVLNPASARQAGPFRSRQAATQALEKLRRYKLLEKCVDPTGCYILTDDGFNVVKSFRGQDLIAENDLENMRSSVARTLLSPDTSLRANESFIDSIELIRQVMSLDERIQRLIFFQLKVRFGLEDSARGERVNVYQTEVPEFEAEPLVRMSSRKPRLPYECFYRR